jgi:hypothetical protein
MKLESGQWERGAGMKAVNEAIYTKIAAVATKMLRRVLPVIG